MIEVTNLTKTFGAKTAVNDLSFQVQKGEVLGFLGPNGAGKSTTMRMVTGYFPPTTGQISICGIDMLKSPEKAKAKIGYLPESAPLYDDMTVVGFLRFAANIRGLGGTDRKDAVEKAIVAAKKALINDHIDHCLAHAEATNGVGSAVEEFRSISKYL